MKLPNENSLLKWFILIHIKFYLLDDGTKSHLKHFVFQTREGDSLMKSGIVFSGKLEERFFVDEGGVYKFESTFEEGGRFG